MLLPSAPSLIGSKTSNGYHNAQQEGSAPVAMWLLQHQPQLPTLTKLCQCMCSTQCTS